MPGSSTDMDSSTINGNTEMNGHSDTSSFLTKVYELIVTKVVQEGCDRNRFVTTNVIS